MFICTCSRVNNIAFTNDFYFKLKNILAVFISTSTKIVTVKTCLFDIKTSSFLKCVSDKMV